MNSGGENSPRTLIKSNLLAGRAQNAEPVQLRPPWFEKPWMYQWPKVKKDQVDWLRNWGHFLLKWCEEKLLHVISIQDVISDPAFHHSRRPLTVESIRHIFQSLIEKGLAKWVNLKYLCLRVYWKSLAAWADEIYRWGLNGGGTTLDIYQIQKSKQRFSGLPKKDIIEILALLVREQRAEWLDRVHYIVQLRW
ncbi:MAG: hypothetical protein ACTSYO_01240 [Candidatus Ranarchaeia archaeon]